MKSLRKYKVTIEDESHLSQIISTHFSLPGLIVFILISFFFLLAISGLIISFTPLRTFLPGYLKESQRSANEEGLLRLDSLMEIYEKDRAFVENFLKVTDIERFPQDSASLELKSTTSVSDTLLGPSKAEREFVSRMEESERFNVSVLAPLAADNMMFYPIARNGIFAKESETSTDGKILLPGDASIQAAAKGSVIAIYYSAPEHGYVLIVQHNNGFVTSYSHTGRPMVSVGENIEGGQALAALPSPDARDARWYIIRMWHNGLPVIPYDYISGNPSSELKSSQKYESPRGKL